MEPSGSATPVRGGSQSVSPRLVQCNSGILGSQGTLMSLPRTFSSGVISQAQDETNLLANTRNVSLLVNQTFVNGATKNGLSSSGFGGFRPGNANGLANSYYLPTVTTDVAMPASCSPVSASYVVNSGYVLNQQQLSSPGNLMSVGQQQSQLQKVQQHSHQCAQQTMQHCPVSCDQLQSRQPQFQTVRGGGLNRMSPQEINTQVGLQQQFQPVQNPKLVNQDQQQNQTGKGKAPSKREHQYSDQALFMHPQKLQKTQKQQFQSSSRQASPASVSLMNLSQQQQQENLPMALPQQQPHIKQQFKPPVISVGRPSYQPGMCAKRVTEYMYQMNQRPRDNNINFWYKFVAEFFAPKAKTVMCFSAYGDSRRTNAVLPQDIWQCEICNKRGHGFGTTVEVLPRLFKANYDSGILEELLYVDMPRESQNASGQIVLEYGKATQESIYEGLRVVRDGQLRIVFSPYLKICCWEFCVQRHEEFIPQKWLIPAVNQLEDAAKKYQASAFNTPSNSTSPDLENNCNAFVAAAHQLAKSVEVPVVDDLGYQKRYVRFLQMAEVVNSMDDLIDCSNKTGVGPMECLSQWKSSRGQSSRYVPEQWQNEGQNLKSHHDSTLENIGQPSVSNGAAIPSNTQNMTSGATSTSTTLVIPSQNSLNSRVENQKNSPYSPYDGVSVQIPSAGSSTVLPSQTNPSSPFSALTPSSSYRLPQTIQSAFANSATTSNIGFVDSSRETPQQSAQTNPTESDEASFDKFMQEIMALSQFNSSGGAAVVSTVENIVGSDDILVGNDMLDDFSNE